ncbi:MAG: PIG-L family deacetylase [Phycisphaerales bacterium]|nr:PIG-L family deacetylase [Phycisphaerales bacterium]
MSRIALCFLAHPDDAEILCAGTLARLAEAGWIIHIITATAGDCGTMTLTPQEISAIRTQEAKKAAECIGATYHCLDEKDIYVCYNQATLQKTVDLFRQIAPSLVITHPVKDYMMDHEMVHLLARAASFGYSAPNASRWPVLAGSRVPHLYYCDPVEGLDPNGNLVTPTTLIDITGSMDTKEQMLACHASQRQWLRAHHGMDEYIDAMKRHGAMRGKQAGFAYAEAFVQHRGHGYPHDDLLTAILGSKGK